MLEPSHANVEPLVLRPARRTAAVWAGAALVLVVVGWWFVTDSAGHPAAWLALAVFTAVATFFVAQAAVPGRFEVVLDEDGLRTRLPWQHEDIPWHQVHLARVRRKHGDQVLELHVHDLGPVRRDGDDRTFTIDVLLPIGYDDAALHAFLAYRLGEAPPPPPEGYTTRSRPPTPHPDPRRTR